MFRNGALLAVFLLGCSPEGKREVAPEVPSSSDGQCPEGVWIDVSAGGGITCGVCATGKLACWGDRPEADPYDTGYLNYGDMEAPDGAFASVEVTKDSFGGSATACALDAEGNPTCWGRNDGGQADPPDKHFTALSLGASDTCGLDLSGAVHCWGSTITGDVPAIPEGAGFTQLISNASLTCALAENGDSTCWWPVSSSPTDFFVKPGPWVRLAAVNTASCAVSSEGLATCWQYASGEVVPLLEGYGMATDGPLGDLCLMRYGGCALSPAGTATCFGPYAMAPPRDTFVQLTCGSTHACGLTADGKLECWGKDCGPECDVP